jgi:hypothetical protein
LAYLIGKGERASIEGARKSLAKARRKNRRQAVSARQAAKTAGMWAAELAARDRNSRSLGYDELSGRPYDGSYEKALKAMGGSRSRSTPVSTRATSPPRREYTEADYLADLQRAGVWPR